MEEQSLFPAPKEGEVTWVRKFDVPGGQQLEVVLFQSVINEELKDQASLRSSVRKAALRSSQKQIARLAKKGVAKLNKTQLEEMRWSLFICLVDTVLAGRHLRVRGDAKALESLSRDSLFKSA